MSEREIEINRERGMFLSLTICWPIWSDISGQNCQVLSSYIHRYLFISNNKLSLRFDIQHLTFNSSYCRAHIRCPPNATYVFILFYFILLLFFSGFSLFTFFLKNFYRNFWQQRRSQLPANFIKCGHRYPILCGNVLADFTYLKGGNNSI